MADPMALVVADAAARAVEFVGLPEAQLNLAQAVVHLATAPKSNRVGARHLARARGRAQRRRRRGAAPPARRPLPRGAGRSATARATSTLTTTPGLGRPAVPARRGRRPALLRARPTTASSRRCAAACDRRATTSDAPDDAGDSCSWRPCCAPSASPALVVVAGRACCRRCASCRPRSTICAARPAPLARPSCATSVDEARDDLDALRPRARHGRGDLGHGGRRVAASRAWRCRPRSSRPWPWPRAPREPASPPAARRSATDVKRLVLVRGRRGRRRRRLGVRAGARRRAGGRALPPGERAPGTAARPRSRRRRPRGPRGDAAKEAELQRRRDGPARPASRRCRCSSSRRVGRRPGRAEPRRTAPAQPPLAAETAGSAGADRR